MNHQSEDKKPTEPTKERTFWGIPIEELGIPILLCTIGWIGSLCYQGKDDLGITIVTVIAVIGVFLVTEKTYTGILSGSKKQQTTFTIFVMLLFGLLFFPNAVSFINGVTTNGLFSQLPFEFKSWYYWNIIRFVGFNAVMLIFLPIAIIQHLSHVFKIIDIDNYERDDDEIFQFGSVGSLLAFCIFFIAKDSILNI
ncbi:MAG: hypothetical protein IPN33_17175 [Saprospiraceae bacterium]|nr:hypothetical protein [Saprospiraceae bacterium]